MLQNANALVRLRKRQFEQAEKRVAALNAEIAGIEKEMAAWREQMRKIAVPEQGAGRLLGQVVAERDAARAAVAVCKERLGQVRLRLEEAKGVLQALHKALEQAKSIESQTLKELAKKAARRDRAMQDEVAAGRFWRNRPVSKEGL